MFKGENCVYICVCVRVCVITLTGGDIRILLHSSLRVSMKKPAANTAQ